MWKENQLQISELTNEFVLDLQAIVGKELVIVVMAKESEGFFSDGEHLYISNGNANATCELIERTKESLLETEVEHRKTPLN